MKKYITILAIILICHNLFATTNFQSADDLIAHLKQENSRCVSYDTNGLIVDVELPPSCSTDHNIHLLSQIKSVRHLLICCGGGMTSNASPALAEFPNLTGLGLLCCGGRGHIVPGLPALTNLQALFLAPNSYTTNDAIYLAKMTNLMALQIIGVIPQTRTELVALTNLVNLRKLVLSSEDKCVNQVDVKIFSGMDKLTNLVVTSDYDNPAVTEWVWKTPVEK